MPPITLFTEFSVRAVCDLPTTDFEVGTELIGRDQGVTL
jgi:hypothetical protein